MIYFIIFQTILVSIVKKIDLKKYLINRVNRQQWHTTLLPHSTISL